MVALLNSESQFKTLISSSKVTLVDWFAEWCGPCKAVAPELDRMEKEFPQIQFIKVDVDKFPSLAAAYSVSAMPTFTFIKNSKSLDTIVGADVNKIRLLLSKLGSSSSSFGSGGRVLGSGKVAPNPKQTDVGGNLMFYGLLGVFILYLYFNKS
jgi:thioredoxin 1